MTSLQRRAALATALIAGLGTPGTAQMPADLASVELARSRDCVPVLGRLEGLDGALAPLAERSQRLLSIAEAVALEDDAIVASLDPTDPVEAAVRAWFDADAELASRLLAAPSPGLQEERAAGRDAVKATVAEAVEAVQARADSTIQATGDLQQQASRCAGAVLVRGAVLESCGATASSVCTAARDSTYAGVEYRFVESPETLWELQELRAWTQPGPMALTPAGEMGGARTVSATRRGNVAVSVTFAPSLHQRTDLTPEASERALALADTLGFGGAHPNVIFVPSLAIRATLPAALAGESGYLFHFGAPESADIVWAAPADTGNPVQGIVLLAPRHIDRLRAGDPLTLTAIREADDGVTDALFAVELSSLNQSPAVGGLLGYMASQLPADLARLVPSDGP